MKYNVTVENRNVAGVTTEGNKTVAIVSLPRGAIGPKGEAATISVGTVTSGQTGDSANVVNVGTTENAIFNFTLPRGPAGDKGADGDEVQLRATETAIEWKYLNEGLWTTLVSLQDLIGPQGDRGDAATITVGNVITGDAGTQAVITNTNTVTDAVLDFSIPKGDKGDRGEPGPSLELRSTSTHLQWRVAGTAVWTNLVPLADIVGPKGDTGDPGVVYSTIEPLDTEVIWINPEEIYNLVVLPVNLDTAFLPTEGQYLSFVSGRLAWVDLSVGIQDIDASGTPSNTTFLRGDGNWAEVVITESDPVYTAQGVTKATDQEITGTKTFTSRILSASAGGLNGYEFTNLPSAGMFVSAANTELSIIGPSAGTSITMTSTNVGVTGNLTFTGTLNSGNVPWARLTDIAVTPQNLSATNVPSPTLLVPVYSSATQFEWIEFPRDEVIFSATAPADTEVIWINPLEDAPTASDFVLRSGDTMTGPLTLSNDPIQFANQAATKAYVDAVVSGGTNIALSVEWGNIVAPAGGSIAAQTDLQNALDAKLNLTGGTVNGQILLTQAPNTANSAVNKAYVDNYTDPFNSVGGIYPNVAVGGATVADSALSVNWTDVQNPPAFLLAPDLTTLVPNSETDPVYNAEGVTKATDQSISGTKTFTSKILSGSANGLNGYEFSNLTNAGLFADVGQLTLKYTGGLGTGPSVTLQDSPIGVDINAFGGTVGINADSTAFSGTVSWVGNLTGGNVPWGRVTEKALIPSEVLATGTPVNGNVLVYQNGNFVWGEGGGGGTLTEVNWGDITGTITNQTDLINRFVVFSDTALTSDSTNPAFVGDVAIWINPTEQVPVPVTFVQRSGDNMTGPLSLTPPFAADHATNKSYVDDAISNHTHPISQITNLTTTLDGKSNVGHSHVISDITGLSTSLTAKADVANTVTTNTSQTISGQKTFSTRIVSGSTGGLNGYEFSSLANAGLVTDSSNLLVLKNLGALGTGPRLSLAPDPSRITLVATNLDIIAPEVAMSGTLVSGTVPWARLSGISVSPTNINTITGTGVVPTDGYILSYDGGSQKFEWIAPPTSGITGTVPVSQGGTGREILVSNTVLVGNNADPILQLPRSGIDTRTAFPTNVESIVVNSGTRGTTTFLRGDGTWSTPTLTGTVQVAQGGTGRSTLTSDTVLVGDGTNVVRLVNRSGIDTRTSFPTSVTDINATGTADSTTFLRGDGQWATPAGGGVIGTIAVNQGGTGRTSLTANSVLVGNGTDPVSMLSRSGIDSRTIFPTNVVNITGTSGTRSSSTYLRGDGAWVAPPFVAKSGDTMTGPLTLSGDPASPLQAATKQYVDANIGGDYGYAVFVTEQRFATAAGPADPTGLVDSTAQIQNALNSITEGTLVFPPGDYKISGNLSITNKNAGNDQPTLVISGEGATLVPTRTLRSQGDLYKVIISGCKRIRIQGLNFPNVDLSLRGCWFSEFNQIKFSRLYFREQVGSGSFQSNSWLNFNNCLFQSVYHTDVATTVGESYHNEITFNSCQIWDRGSIPIGSSEQGFANEELYALRFESVTNAQSWKFYGGDISNFRQYDKDNPTVTKQILYIDPNKTGDVELLFDGMYIDFNWPKTYNNRRVKIDAVACHHANIGGVDLPAPAALSGKLDYQRRDRSFRSSGESAINLIPNGDFKTKFCDKVLSGGSDVSYIGTGRPISFRAGTNITVTDVEGGPTGRYLNIVAPDTVSDSSVTFGGIPAPFNSKYTGGIILRNADAEFVPRKIKIGFFGYFTEALITNDEWTVCTLTGNGPVSDTPRTSYFSEGDILNIVVASPNPPDPNNPIIPIIGNAAEVRKNFSIDVAAVWINAGAGSDIILESQQPDRILFREFSNRGLLADGTQELFNFTVPGATFDHFVQVTTSASLLGLDVTAWVSAADTVTIKLRNTTGASVDLPNIGWKLLLTKSPW